MSNIREQLIDNMTENLPVLRKKLKLSQEGLAQIIGTSRYTVMLIETRKRRMTWNTFLSLVLLFDKNADTSVLIRVLEIYTEQLDAYLRLEENAGF
jgi:DNA-binding XRE family transcriptional regulator